MYGPVPIYYLLPHKHHLWPVQRPPLDAMMFPKSELMKAGETHTVDVRAPSTRWIAAKSPNWKGITFKCSAYNQHINLVSHHYCSHYYNQILDMRGLMYGPMPVSKSACPSSSGTSY